MGTGDLDDVRAHHGSPESPQVVGNLTGDVIAIRDVRGDLVRHLHQVRLLVVEVVTHAGTWADGRTSTAVTLYSGQLVAQSELSVVMTLVPLTGWWKVV